MTDELMVRVVGPFAVYRADLALAPTEVGSRKARNLLALLAMYRGYVPADRIVGAVWGDVLPRDPIANLATLVSRLRASLGSHTIRSGRAGYRLDDRVRVDLCDGAGLIVEAERWIAAARPARALLAARDAVRLLDNGEVLADEPEARWAEPVRARHGWLLRQARCTAARTALRVGDPRFAQAVAADAVIADPLDEEACRMLMRAHHAAGEPARALRAYQRFRVCLATELGVDPAPATRDLHVAILRGEQTACRP